jgi:hypothetical protein
MSSSESLEGRRFVAPTPPPHSAAAAASSATTTTTSSSCLLLLQSHYAALRGCGLKHSRTTLSNHSVDHFVGISATMASASNSPAAAVLSPGRRQSMLKRLSDLNPFRSPSAESDTVEVSRVTLSCAACHPHIPVRMKTRSTSS